MRWLTPVIPVPWEAEAGRGVIPETEEAMGERQNRAKNNDTYA